IRKNSTYAWGASIPWSEKEMSVHRNWFIPTGPMHFTCGSFPSQTLIPKTMFPPSPVAFFVHRYPLAFDYRGTSRYLHHFKAAPEKWFTHPDFGALRGNGGRANLGRKTPGVWKLFF